MTDYLVTLDDVSADLAKEALRGRARHHFEAARRASREVDPLPYEKKRTASLRIQAELAASQRLEDLADALTANPVPVVRPVSGARTIEVPIPVSGKAEPDYVPGEPPTGSAVTVGNPADPEGDPAYALDRATLDSILDDDSADEDDPE